MKRKVFLSIALFLFAITLWGQQDTIYFNDNEKYQYQVKEYAPDNPDKITVTTYFKSGKVSSQFHYLCDSERKFDRTEKKEHEEVLFSQTVLGIFFGYTGKLDGQLLTYWENGNAKRIDEYKNGKLITGKCFNVDGEEIAYFDYQTPPVFSDGEKKLHQYLSKEIKYPKDSRKNKIEGRAVIRFIINTDGSVSDIKILQSVSEDIDNESIRVVEKMPKWTPSKIDGEAVRIFYTLPIQFRL